MIETLPIIQTFECRLCFDEDTLDNLIAPCKCSGTSKYVHKNCLNEWRMLADNREAYNKCFECNYNYKFRDIVINNTSFFHRFLKFLSKNLIIFTVINFFIMLLFTIFLYNVDKNRKMPDLLIESDKNSTYIPKDRNSLLTGYFLWSSVIYVIFLLIVFIVNFIYIKNKNLYIKYFCKQQNSFFIVVIIICGVALTMDYIIGFIAMSIALQYLIKNHIFSVEKIREENNLEIVDYCDEDDLLNEDNVYE